MEIENDVSLYQIADESDCKPLSPRIRTSSSVGAGLPVSKFGICGAVAGMESADAVPVGGVVALFSDGRRGGLCAPVDGKVPALPGTNL